MSIPLSQQLPTADSSRMRDWLVDMHSRLNHDFFPAANRWVYWMKQPFWIVALSAITAIICGICVSATALVFGAGLASLLALAVLWPWLSLRGIDGRLRFIQTRGRTGQPVMVEIELTNRWPWPVWGLELTRGFFPTRTDQSAGLALSCIGGWSNYCVKWTFLPSRRGVYPLEIPQIESAFPFGLYRASRSLTCENNLIVWPRSTVLSVIPDLSTLLSRDDRTSDRRAGNVGDMLGTRLFRQGDSLRRVHWSQSARHQRLIVTERQTPLSCSLRLVLDLCSHHHQTRGSEDSLNSLLSVAASVIESLHREHAFAECVIGSNCYQIGSAQADLRVCLDALAMIPAAGLTEQTSLHVLKTGKSRHATIPEYILTTSSGITAFGHSNERTSRSKYIVLNLADDNGRRAGTNCTCSCWLELTAAKDHDVLTQLPGLWRKACDVN